jgi:hypothetical protein
MFNFPPPEPDQGLWCDEYDIALLCVRKLMTLSEIMHFTNHNVPGCVDKPCYTAFYEDDVLDLVLDLPDGSRAAVISWNPNEDLPQVDRVTILKVSEMPQGIEAWARLEDALVNARHRNIRLILPRGKYPPKYHRFIDS